MKGGANNRKHRQQRKGKGKNVFTGITKHKLAKLDQDENKPYSYENVDVPSDVTGSVTAIFYANPATNAATASSSVAFPNEESEWVDVVEEEIGCQRRKEKI